MKKEDKEKNITEYYIDLYRNKIELIKEVKKYGRKTNSKKK